VRISIFGLGYVGAVSLACLARDGHQVTGVDIDPGKLDLIRRGLSPIIEEGIQELMRAVVSSGRVKVTTDAAEALMGTDISFICVGTPSSPNGSQDLGAVLRLAEHIGAALKRKNEFHTIVVRSTVQPGTVEGSIGPIIEQASGKRSGTDFGLCFQPEFLREGTSIRDYDDPPFTIVGSNSERSTQSVREIFGHLPCEFLGTQVRTAEMLKMACNAFHALKITFANEIGRIAQSQSVDSHEVMRLVCKDTRLNISPAYLRPGFAFGGSCLPKDLRALTHLAKQADMDAPLLTSLLASNRVHVDHAVNRVLALKARKVGMLGLAFKTGTDDLRESPLVTVAKKLIGEGVQLQIFDPEVNLSRLVGANRRYIEETIPHIGSLMSSTMREMIMGKQLIIVGLSSQALTAQLYSLLTPEQHVLDLVNLPDHDALGARYHGVCW
jgi:GDP-mannose 6-dehydrogenase